MEVDEDRHILEVDKASRMLVSFNLDEKKVEEILDEMRPIRCIEHKGHAKRITHLQLASVTRRTGSLTLDGAWLGHAEFSPRVKPK